jgi:opacity protein-like surface antigen
MSQMPWSFVAVVSLIAGPAVAADLPVKTPRAAPSLVAPVFNWSGLYFGGGTGAQWFGSNSSYLYPGGGPDGPSAASGKLTDTQAFMTFQFGRNWQAVGSPVVFGIEGDWTETNHDRMSTLYRYPNGTDHFDAESQLGVQGSVRGRLGYAWDNWLLYATGGLALAQGEAISTFTGDALGASSVSYTNKTLYGWTVGGGLEWALPQLPNVSLRLEYRYTDYGSISTASSGAATAGAFPTPLGPYLSHADFATNDFRIGVNYRFGDPAIFGTPPAPAAASAPAMPVKAAPAAPVGSYNMAAVNAAAPQDFFSRLVYYYGVEWGHDGAPADPSAPPSRRSDWPATPETTPPMPFTEWPYGGSTTIGVTRPASVDSPLMFALANTAPGKWLADNNIQIYGWVNAGGNISTDTHRPGGNFPAAYMYTPNTIQLDQAVIYFERLPDTVQTDHVDWGFRLSGLYGENYRYTTAYGLFSYQLLNHNLVNGYDFPMMYGEMFIPGVAQGLLLRLGRFISLPDIEAQLAPNNYMYSHSLTYGYDNYTNTGLQATLAATKNLFLQLGVTVGSDTMPWNFGPKIPNLSPNPVFTDTTMLKDPGAKPSVTGCVRYQTDSGHDDIYLCADAENDGTWGYNNLQWYGGTYYHRFNDQWHISIEAYELGERNVPNANNPAMLAAFAGGGTPFSPQYVPFNAPGLALCSNTVVFSCTTEVRTFLTYLNYSPTTLDNISFRGEFYDDMQGQRTGVATRYVDFGLGWQRWLSPQVEVRPEVSYYRSLDAAAFNGEANAGIPPNKFYAIIGSMDMILHF